MMRTRPGALALLLILLVASPGCGRFAFNKKKEPLKPFVPPPIVVRTEPPQPLVVGEPPPNPGAFLDASSIPYPLFGGELELPERPKPPAPKPRPANPPSPAVEATEPPATTPPVAVPQLTQILSEEDAKKYRSEVDEASRSAEKVLDAATKRRLNATQLGLVRQVSDFLRQAQQQRDTDLVTARNLARRAAILARDLQSTLR